MFKAVSPILEWIFMGGLSGGGNRVISYSSNLRLRQACIKYKNILVGQAWTIFQNISSLAEAANF
jgi:hypothetical protein